MIKDWVEAMRLRTLPVSTAGVLTGIGFALAEGTFKAVPAVLCLVFALLAQIASNFANEYYDYKRGADKPGRVGPRRGVTEGAISPKTMRNVTFITLAVACIVGCCLIPYGGWKLIIVGVLIAIFAIAYSAGPFPLSRNGLGDVAVLVFFGIVPVNFTYYVQAGSFHFFVALASITIGLLAVNVLLVNNYRDMEDDIEAGKKTTVVIFGRKAAASGYLINGYMGMGAMMPVWFLFPWWSFCPLIYLTLHTATWIMMMKRSGAALNPILGATARNMLIFAILLFICCCYL